MRRLESNRVGADSLSVTHWKLFQIWPYIVTNRHVVAKAGNPVIRLNRKDGDGKCISEPREAPHVHSHREVLSFYIAGC
jgi:hypothetical protein